MESAVSAIFIDDITFAQFGNSAELEGYDVYCDGEKLNETMLSVPEFRHVAAAEGTHTYHVVALYKEGMSDLSNKATVLVSGLDEIMADGVGIYTTPGTIHITNANGKVSIVSPNGMVIYTNAEPAEEEAVKVAPGVYMVTVNGNTARVIVK